MGDFLIRDNFIDCSRKIEEPIERLAFYDCIFEYGDTGSDILESCPISEDAKKKMRLVLKHIFISMSNTNERHERAVENGRKGGLKGGKLGGRGNRKNER